MAFVFHHACGNKATERQAQSHNLHPLGLKVCVHACLSALVIPRWSATAVKLTVVVVTAHMSFFFHAVQHRAGTLGGCGNTGS